MTATVQEKNCDVNLGLLSTCSINFFCLLNFFPCSKISSTLSPWSSGNDGTGLYLSPLFIKKISSREICSVLFLCENSFFYVPMLTQLKSVLNKNKLRASFPNFMVSDGVSLKHILVTCRLQTSGGRWVMGNQDLQPRDLFHRLVQDNHYFCPCHLWC